MGSLEGRVAIITGAGRGLGREHALLFAREGAKVVVNDLGSASDGSGADAGPAQQVVEEVRSGGGEAVANNADVADFEAARSLVEQAVAEFGRLDVLVNNAGILRDAFFASMSEDQWDAIFRVHLKGHFCPMRHAVEHWKTRSKGGEEVKAAVINTASPSGLFMPNPGQTNYGAAKAAIAALTQVAALELGRFGVRVNAIAPGARTRMTADVPGIGEAVKAPDDPDAFDFFDPANVSPIVAALATEACAVTGQVYFTQGGVVSQLDGWRVADELVNAPRRTTVAELCDALGAAVAA